MPATSIAQRRLFAIAEHSPSKLKNKKILGSMDKEDMHDFAATPEKGLPEHSAKDKTAKLKALRAK